MENLPFSKRFINLFRKIIDRREFLVQNGYNRRPESEMRRSLQKHFTNIGTNWNDEGAAKFLQENYEDLRMMIPGRETNLKTELDTLYEASTNFIKKNQPCKQYQLKLSVR